MAVSPTPEQLQYGHHNTTEGYGSFVLGTRIPILLISLVGLVGNGQVLWLLGFHIQRSPFSVYILNLAAADALFLCCSFLTTVERFVLYINYPDSRVMLFLTDTSYAVGLSLLAAISTERCLSVLFPLWYRCHRPKHRSAVVCAVLWGLLPLFWGIGFVICISYVCLDPLIIKFVWFLLLTPVMCVSSLALLLRVQCTSGRRQPPGVYLLVLLSVLVFLLCGIPMGIAYFIHPFASVPFGLLQLLACVNSSANPFIYFFLGIQRHRRRRETLKVILQRALGDEEKAEEEARNSPRNNTQEILS